MMITLGFPEKDKEHIDFNQNLVIAIDKQLVCAVDGMPRSVKYV
jgi:hypothetical protein